MHECPDWPTWALCDSPDVQELLGITKTERLQFYDIAHAQWVTCLPSYPHQVSKTRHLLLRRVTVTSCFELDKYLAAITEVPTHMWRNMANERSAIKQQLHAQRYKKINVFSPPTIIDLSGDNDRGSGKRKVLECELDETPLRQRRRLSPSSTISVSNSPMPRQTLFGSISGVSTPSASHSRAVSEIMDSSGDESDDTSANDEIIVPEDKKWPAGMYTVHMARGFRKVDCQSFKDLKLSLSERIFRTFQQNVPRNTYNDQVRFWKRASQEQRDSAVNAGQSKGGLWSAFPRVKG